MNTTNTKSKRTHSNDDSKHSPSKRQFRNENEKRRRDLFSQLIGNLEEILNIDKPSSADSQVNKLDKASILRETADYLRKHHDNLIYQTNVSSSSSRTTVDRTNTVIDFSWKPPSNLLTTEEWIQIAIESMNCFFLVAKSDLHNGQIVYVSKNISSLLDYSQNELLNRSLFELILPCHHDQLRDYILKDHRVLEKCSLSWRRATADEYEQCTLIGAFRQINKPKEEVDEKYLMSIVKVNTLDRTLIINNESSIHEFTTRINLQGKFTHIDPKAEEYLGYSSYELIGHTHFDFVHPDDLPIVLRAHQLWKKNGNGKSDSYRFLTKGQQWIFLQTSSQVQVNSWTGKPESYLCTTNPLQNSTDSLQKQLSSIATSSRTVTSSSSNQSCFPTTLMLTSNPSKRNSATDTQITSFLSHLGNETYRTNIRQKLNERRIYKQAEIRVREDEIKVIEDIIQFIDEFQAKRSTSNSSLSHPSLPPPPPPPSITTTTIDLTKETMQEDSLNRSTELKSNRDQTLLRYSLLDAMEGLSPQSSPMLSRYSLSKDEIISDPLSSPIYSPQQGTFSIASPMTPFSVLSRPSPMTPIPLSVSPICSPLNNNSTIQDINNIKPPPSTSSSTSTSSSSTTTTSSTNSNVLSTEESSKKSFNRSLPRSLVS